MFVTVDKTNLRAVKREIAQKYLCERLADDVQGCRQMPPSALAHRAERSHARHDSERHHKVYELSMPQITANITHG